MISSSIDLSSQTGKTLCIFNRKERKPESATILKKQESALFIALLENDFGR